VNRLPAVAGLLVACLAAAVCVRLGVWQISRLHEKQALNARIGAALAAPARDLYAADSTFVWNPDSLAFARYITRGRFDESRQFLLMGRAHDGEPGVAVVTPLIEEGEVAVLIDRGWIPSYDAAIAQPDRFPAPGIRTITGLAEPIERAATRGRPAPYRRVEIDSLEVWSTPRLLADSISARLPYPVRPYVLRALPDAEDSAEVARAVAVGAPAGPLRSAPRHYDENMHRGYAGQWFAFAAIILIGSIVLSRRRPAR
jgi:surfeit locus 1 family protein